jgi:hypothetical protein
MAGATTKSGILHPVSSRVYKSTGKRGLGTFVGNPALLLGILHHLLYVIYGTGINSLVGSDSVYQAAAWFFPYVGLV